MTARRSLKFLVAAAVVLGGTASPSLAQDPRVEVGASLVHVTARFGLDSSSDATMTAVGVGSSFQTFDLSPGVYLSFFLGSRFSIRPQVGLVWLRVAGESAHLVNVAGQVEYFLAPVNRRSAYVLGAVGLLDATGNGGSPRLFSGGVGYRLPVGDTLAVRVEGRVSRMIVPDEENSNGVMINVLLGGVFVRR